ncbi:MAG: hydantoinase B/oxoprolinase family protein [Gemmatimonadota bacterium]
MPEESGRAGGAPLDAARLEVFRHLLESVAEEMGAVLRRTAYSPNIKERLDFSCAVFDAAGRLVAQAAHIPVHLGAMPLSVEACVRALPLGPGDIAIVNDPYRGGTHLPDITMVTPVFVDRGKESSGEGLLGFVASRAHHADVGGISPGSMPLATEVFQEGLIIPPVKLIERGAMSAGVRDLLLANVRTPEERAGDLRAQIASGLTGTRRLAALVRRYGLAEVERYMAGLLAYTERMTRHLLADLPDGSYAFRDALDPEEPGGEPVEIAVSVTIEGDEATVDFSGSSAQRRSGLNAVYAITLSATAYVFRALMGLDVPANAGCLAPIRLIAPEGTVVNARPPAPVAAGNVETSQRITDVLLGALAKACPDRVPAASQGTMNNVTIGGWDPVRARPFAYYETIAGGAGALPSADGTSGVHTHMTNTRNTPIEAIEYAYPLRVRRYEIRRGSGGDGRFAGGDGIRRDFELLSPGRVTILSDRRATGPYGLAGGHPGRPGRNSLLRGGETRELPGRVSLDVEAGDVLRIETPGGGGHGRPPTP